MSATVALDLLLALIARSQQISAIIQQARAEGRETLTDLEWQSIFSADDAARSDLVAAIEKAKAEGR